MLRENLLQTKLSPDIINIILKYELTLDNLNKKCCSNKTNYNDFTTVKITDLLIRALKTGYYGYSFTFLKDDNKLKWFNYINKIIKNSDINDKITVLSGVTSVIIHLKGKEITNHKILNSNAFQLNK